MVGGEENKVHLGLCGDADLEAFRRVAHEAHHHETPFDIESHVQTFPAEPQSPPARPTAVARATWSWR
jgi:hypothetical protein